MDSILFHFNPVLSLRSILRLFSHVFELADFHEVFPSKFCMDFLTPLPKLQVQPAIKSFR
jgi:hypothetical protein